MNFLSHFYIDRQRQEPLFVMGILTPDLLSIYNAELRIKASRTEQFDPVAAGIPIAFYEGLSKHFFVDRIFHSSPLFAAETAYLSEQLETYFPGRDIQRKFFIAHILLELQLDQLLIRRDPTIVDDFYAHFEAARPFEELRIATEKVSGHPLPNYEHFLEKFTENRYLRHYRDHSHIIYILGRLLRRVQVADTSFLTEKPFERLMDAYHTRLETKYKPFFEEIWQAQP